ncbi:MAG: TldD/PmbA family protein [Nitrososphaeraceae archaeon]|jgi:TldD protein
MIHSLVIDDLQTIISKSRGTKYVEARYQSRITNEVNFSNGELEMIRSVLNSGCGFRVLVEGCWGFSSTNDLSKKALRDSLSEAISVAKVLAETKKNKVAGLAAYKIVRGLFKTKAKGDLASIDIEQKVKIAKEAESQARRYSMTIKAASCIYHEILDHKIIVNSDGTEVEIYDSKPEFNVMSVARTGSESVTTSEGIGITGGWEDLFFKRDHLGYANLASEKAIKLLEAKHVSGEKTTIVLEPGMVGLISHEAIGHMVEADFVLSGSMVKDKIGQKVANELVTLVDSGQSNIAANAAGTIAVDDEGIMAGRTVIIENGVLKSFLHNRETALIFDTEPTGNARAFEYNDEPLIRMRNTFIEPGNDKVDDIIKETKHGYLIKGPRNGQADANGEFMFGSQEAYLIENGEIKELMKGASISGSAFDVLQSVDMVGNDFDYDIGTGYCGKFQPAKVDGGGPHLRCTAIIGGLQ